MKIDKNECLAAHVAGPVALIDIPIIDEAGRAVHHVGQTVGAGQELITTSGHGVVAVSQVGTIRRAVEVTRS